LVLSIARTSNDLRSARHEVKRTLVRCENDRSGRVIATS
jgi:hypothetical protein